jgi:hypothetical protein
MIKRQFVGVLVLFAIVSVRSQAQTCQITAQQIRQSAGVPPTEINPAEGPGTCGFLKFSWRAFLALNWPAISSFDRSDTTKQTRAMPDIAKVIGQGAASDPTVWDLFQPNWYLFAPNNPPPNGFAGWNQDAMLPSTCGQIMRANAARLTDAQKSSLKILSSLSKFDSMPGVSQAFSSAPLIDQNGFYARYEIRTSFETFNYIVSNRFYSAAGQENQTFNFPIQNGSKPGAIFIKASWKVLTPEEARSGRFHTAQAFLFTPSSPDVQSTCAGPVPVGLVGLHIVQKTRDFPKWLWATFEQVDTSPADPANPGTQNWHFFRTGSPKGLDAPACPTAASPCVDWQPTSSHLTDATGGPTQATRLNPIGTSQNQPALDQINQSVMAALREINPSSVWQFYRLVEAQWQRDDTATGFFPPTRVANITMETYTQKGSCMACHSAAVAADGNTAADFTFELTLGWRPVVIPAPTPVVSPTP